MRVVRIGLLDLLIFYFKISFKDIIKLHNEHHLPILMLEWNASQSTTACLFETTPVYNLGSWRYFVSIDWWFSRLNINIYSKFYFSLKKLMVWSGLCKKYRLKDTRCITSRFELNVTHKYLTYFFTQSVKKLIIT